MSEQAPTKESFLELKRAIAKYEASFDKPEGFDASYAEAWRAAFRWLTSEGGAIVYRPGHGEDEYAAGMALIREKLE